MSILLLSLKPCPHRYGIENGKIKSLPEGIKFKFFAPMNYDVISFLPMADDLRSYERYSRKSTVSVPFLLRRLITCPCRSGRNIFQPRFILKMTSQH